MKALMLLALTASFSIHAQTIGFSKGNRTDITYLRGQVTAQCQEDNGSFDTRYVACNGYLTAPTSHDFFVHPPTDADKVSLKSIREDGSTRTKSAKFDSENGISKSKFNLAIRTLTQSPLLKIGENKIAYTLSKGNQKVAEGEFIAIMEVVEERNCGSKFMYLPQFNCSDTFRICDELFWRTNNCTN